MNPVSRTERKVKFQSAPRLVGWVVLADRSALGHLDCRLGPEPFERSLTAERLQAALARRPGKIKNALLDQSLVAGLGDIYVDEGRGRTRIYSEHPSNTLRWDQLARLIRAIRLVLNQSLARQGTTLSSFETPYGGAGENAYFLRANGQAKGGGRFGRWGSLDFSDFVE